jgi:hypothetical protein
MHNRSPEDRPSQVAIAPDTCQTLDRDLQVPGDGERRIKHRRLADSRQWPACPSQNSFHTNISNRYDIRETSRHSEFDHTGKELVCCSREPTNGLRRIWHSTKRESATLPKFRPRRSRALVQSTGKVSHSMFGPAEDNRRTHPCRRSSGPRCSR